MPIHRITYLLAFLIMIGALSFLSVRAKQGGRPTSAQPDSQTKVQEISRDFPSVDYEESEPTDPAKRALRQEKQKRFDTFQIVSKNPNPNAAEVALFVEGGPELPALPTEKSNTIIVGVVEDAQAHLSANKKNIYSEFTVLIKDVLKTDTSLLSNNGITVDRDGGVVNYPNGQRVLHQIMRQGMPRVGQRYVFFLEHNDKYYQILTAYELSAGVVSPLDGSEQFNAFRGYDEARFLTTLRDSLAKPAPPEE